MTRSAQTIALLLVGLMLVAAWSQMTKGLLWKGFLFGLPLLLIGFLLTGHRWVFMAGVMYGTVGLALDISTIVQELTRPEAAGSLPASALSGLLNFLLILSGGRGLFDAGPAGSSHAPPRGLPPNPPSQAAS